MESQVNIDTFPSGSQRLERVLSHWAKPAEDNSNMGIPRNKRQAFRALDSAPPAP